MPYITKDVNVETEVEVDVEIEAGDLDAEDLFGLIDEQGDLAAVLSHAFGSMENKDLVDALVEGIGPHNLSVLIEDIKSHHDMADFFTPAPGPQAVVEEKPKEPAYPVFEGYEWRQLSEEEVTSIDYAGLVRPLLPGWHAPNPEQARAYLLANPAELERIWGFHDTPYVVNGRGFLPEDMVRGDVRTCTPFAIRKKVDNP